MCSTWLDDYLMTAQLISVRLLRSITTCPYDHHQPTDQLSELLSDHYITIT